MNKFFVNKEELNSEELKTGKVSYGRLVDRLIPNRVLCNNIVDIDNDLMYNMQVGNLFEYVDMNGNKYTEEEYGNDTEGLIFEEQLEIYQYYLCDLSSWELSALKSWGNVIISYSDVLNLYVLMVDHFGTSWDYVMTDIEWAEYGKE